MFTRGDFDLNLMLRYDPSPKEVLKQAMLKQEHIFRNQMQQFLMKDFDWKEVDRMDTIIQSHLGPSSIGAQPVLLPAEKSLCTFPVVSTRLSVNSLQEHRVVFKQRLLVPQLCSNQHISHINQDHLVKENCFHCPQKPIEIKHCFRGQVTPSSEEADLSLSIGWNKQSKDACEKTWDHIINLEDSIETMSCAEVNTLAAFDYAAHVVYLGGNHDFSSTHSITHGPNKNKSEGTERCHSTVDCSMSLLEQSSFSKGVTQCCNVLISEDMPTHRKLFSSDERALLDLNRHPDELSFHPTDLGLACSPTRTFLRDSHGMVGESHKDTSHTASNRRDQADDDCSNETYDLQKHSAVNSVTGACCNGTNCVTSGSTNLNSSCIAVLDNCESHDGHTSKVELEEVNLTLEFQNGSHTGLPMPAASCSRSGSKHREDTRISDECMPQYTLEDVDIDRSPTLCKSSCVADDLLCRTVAKESGTHLGKSNTWLGNAGSSQAAKSPCQEDVEYSGNSGPNFQIGDDQKGKAAEVDNEVQKGAVSLLFFMLECTRDQSCCTAEASKTRQKENDSNEQPQNSSDTFESMVLELPECNVDDSCVSSKPFEVNNANSKDCGIALRRGRRMKDFRRDILPNLASLSRHEISEDINIMEAVLKSREYKKIKSGMRGGQKWFLPVRSRRSRLNYVGQKHHS